MALEIFGPTLNGGPVWITNGTPAGTLELADAHVQAGEGALGGGVNVGGLTYFAITVDSMGDTELWRTDGTAAGTIDLGVRTAAGALTLFAGAGSVVALGDRPFFINPGNGLWTTDGTAASTHQVLASVSSIVGAAGGGLFVEATENGQSGLFAWNGATGATLLSGLNPATGPGQFNVLDGEAIFVASDGTHGDQLWASNGTVAGTTMLTDINPSNGGAVVFDTDIVNGRLLFVTAPMGGGAAQAWSTTGTVAGTVQIAAAGLKPQATDFVSDTFATVGGVAYFSDGVSLYQTDGTAAGTRVAITGANVFVSQDLGQVNGEFVLDGRFNGSANELAIWNGTSPAATIIATGSADSFVTVGSELYFEFFPNNAQVGQLWESDGTAAGTHLFDNLNGVPAVALGADLLFFNSSDGSEWSTDGTPGGTNQLVNFSTGALLPVTRSIAARADFNADGRSDFLIENGSGAVVVGEAVNGQPSYAAVSGLGPEWSFRGQADFIGDGHQDFLIENTSGVVAVGDVFGGQTTYTIPGGLGSDWKFEGAGDFLGHGHAQFLIENGVGAVVTGEVVNGQAAYTQVAALGSEWKFVGTGDFLGDGRDDFLIQNTAGAVVIGEVVNGSAAYTGAVGLGPEWKFVGTGDFLGEGHSQFLIENANGAVDVGDWANGQVHFTQVAGLGPEWTFVGAGDYLGEGHDQFLIENTAGAIDVGDWVNGTIHFTQIAALGPEWAFH